MGATPTPATVPKPFIIVDGREVPLEQPPNDPNPVQAITYLESGLTFTTSNTKYIKPRDPAALIDLVTAHDQAGEGQGKAFFDRLCAKGLSMHFQIGHTLVDGKPTIYQFNDPSRWTTAHMGPGNSRSIGVEHSNRFSKWWYLWRPLRPLVTETYRGRKRTVLGHLEGQKLAFAVLVRTLLREYPYIPWRLPRDAGGKVTGDRIEAGWAGVASHHHFQESGYVSKYAHIDPCGDIFDLLVPELG